MRNERIMDRGQLPRLEDLFFEFAAGGPGKALTPDSPLLDLERDDTTYEMRLSKNPTNSLALMGKLARWNTYRGATLNGSKLNAWLASGVGGCVLHDIRGRTPDGGLSNSTFELVQASFVAINAKIYDAFYVPVHNSTRAERNGIKTLSEARDLLKGRY